MGVLPYGVLLLTDMITYLSTYRCDFYHTMLWQLMFLLMYVKGESSHWSTNVQGYRVTSCCATQYSAGIFLSVLHIVTRGKSVTLNMFKIILVFPPLFTCFSITCYWSLYPAHPENYIDVFFINDYLIKYCEFILWQ
jgi:hypothetical protein